MSLHTGGEIFEAAYQSFVRGCLEAPVVDTGHWQAIKNVPQTKTKELFMARLQYPIPASVGQLAIDIEPNLPWAEDHFRERVGGEALNPGVQYTNWPHWRGGHRTHDKFSHTYMERFWPKLAAGGYKNARGEATGLRNMGIRYLYGDLDDVVRLLQREPYTRQAYLPVFFPEDTGAVPQERIPCTLGYQFILRENHLHCFYPIRSCDLLRHFRDDVYMACRLTQWVLEQVRTRRNRGTHCIFDDNATIPPPDPWLGVTPGTLYMHMTSLHIFEGDVPLLEKQYG